MGTSRVCILSFVLVALLLLAAPERSWSMNLPLSKELTVKLSALNSQGQLHAVSEVSATTDSLGKISFSFPIVPSSSVTPFLCVQIIDGSDVLRRAIVPAPLPGGAVDVGVSETTDLQARSILKAVAISGTLTPIHLLIAQALVRTPEISATHAESAGEAIAAGVQAFSDVLATDGPTGTQYSVFLGALTRGLTAAAALYRTSVDDSVSFDQKVEAYRRGEAFAVVLQALVTAGQEAGINLESVSTAFAAAGGAAERSLDGNPDLDQLTKAEMRLGYISGILCLSNFRMLRERIASLSHVGISAPRYSNIFKVMDMVWNTTISIQKGADGVMQTTSTQNDLQGIRTQEFNLLATQDLLLFKMGMETYAASTTNPEYAELMLEITGRMAGWGGVMTGMTPELLMEILGRSTSHAPRLDAQQEVQPAARVPTLFPCELGAWSSVHREATFSYTPVPRLADQLVVKPVSTPAFDRLGEPYRSLALLMNDLYVVNSLHWQEQQAAEDESAAHPLSPPGWYPLTMVHRILENDRQRLKLVRQHISGVSLKTKDALIYLSNIRVTEF